MNEKQQTEIQVQAKDDIAQGHYSNIMQLHARKEEFCIDFLNVYPPIGALVARIVVSPGHLKRMIKVLQDALIKHESEFGIVEEAQEPTGSGAKYEIRSLPQQKNGHYGSS